GGRSSSRESVRDSERGRIGAQEIERGLVASGRARIAAFALGAMTIGAIAWVAPDFRHSLADDRRALSAMSVDTNVSRDAFRAAAHAAMLRYPAEAFFPLMGAVREQLVDGASPVPWVARALEQNPKFGRAHFLLARS